jgi:H+-translocating NAD(P) transhydrogenase subunit alpha
MRVGIPKEISIDERRVAIVPALVQTLNQLGCTVILEQGAGINADYPDSSYQDVEFCSDATSLYQQADIVLKVETPLAEEINLLQKNTVLVGFLHPTRYPDRVIALRDHGITSFAMENIPRISRAQSMDALSSQATASGYKSVLLAANMFDRFLPMLTTAAGTIRPANVLVIGAGVAGLQAIATAKRLGAIVKAYDIRSTTKEQVESLGAKMITTAIEADAAGGYARELTAQEQQAQAAALHDAVAKTDILISTALIPDKPAPKIVTRSMIDAMQPGSVIVDIAAEAGGNCDLTQANQVIDHQGVKIYGPVNLPSMLAHDASGMYAKNIVNFLKLLLKDGKFVIDWTDPILAQSVLTHEGDIKHQATNDLIQGKR